MQCPYCNNEHPDEADFCPITGQSLKSSGSSSKICAHCGGIVPPEAQFCPICGETIADGIASGQSIKSSTVSPITCANCGASIPADAQFCPVCGTAITKTTGFEQFILQMLNFFKGNFIRYAGIVVIIIIVILVIFYKWPPSNPPGLTPAAQTQTYLAGQATGSPAPRGTTSPFPSQTVFFFTPTDNPTITIPPATLPPTQTPTEPERKTCPGAPPIRVEIGDTALVTSNCGDHIYMRLNPIVATNVEQYLYAGDELKIIDGPLCSNDVTFFLVEAPKWGKTGWVAEAVADIKVYCIEPVP